MSIDDQNPILLVDDSTDDVDLVLAAFRRTNVKHRVVTLRDGDEALDYLYRRGLFADRSDPIVILMDIKMPKVTGLEVLKRIKSDATLKAIPVVMLTSSNRPADVETSYRLGVNAYVVKPVNFNRLIEAVECLGRFWTKINKPPLSAEA
jgi:CheY-like chemotaxis protein